MTEPTFELSDLELNVDYTVERYIECNGSCSTYYLIKVSREDSTTKQIITVRPGNFVYDHLQQKSKINRFHIMRVSNPLNDSYVMVGSRGNWVELD